MALSKKAEQYRQELKAVAASLPFKTISCPSFRDPRGCPTPVRQKRVYTSPEASMQAIGRFLIERGTVDLLAPEQTLNLFTEIHWCAAQIRMLSRRRLPNAARWRQAVVQARKLISKIEAAEEELFIANRRLVVSCIKPYFWIGQVWLADFLQEGSKALSNAIRKFDFTRGTPFYVYAQKAVQNRLRNYFRDHVRSGSIGMRPSREMLALKEILDAWPKDRGDPPDNAVLASLTGMTEARIAKIRPYVRQLEHQPGPPVSLDAMFADNDSNLYDVVKDSEAEEASHAAQRSEIWSAVDRLLPRSKLIMRLRFIEGRTLEETGAMLNLTRARIKQIQDDALRKLRQMLRRGVTNPRM
ncbi:MAG: sigma-70 family RNA polymerase sigma factor [Verrucomicrobia bacterium]|nr:sigma-70 family RNA polymerase sigma factor [Verrucomicrobiota bacterium]